MKIFPANEVRSIDQYTIKNEPVESIDLMERAANRLVNWLVKRYHTHRKVVIFAGPGNNGGDALALARMLLDRQYLVECYLISEKGKLSADCKVNLGRLEQYGSQQLIWIKNPKDFPVFRNTDLIIDGLFGSGIKGALEGLYKKLIDYINESGDEIISIDIPSGLGGEDQFKLDFPSIIKAKHTLSFQFPFLSFFFEENYEYTGTWHVLDIGLHPEIIENTPSGYKTIEKNEVAEILPKRNKFSHKGSYGHALIIAGSRGMMGAAVLAGKAALRSGAGLVSVHVPHSTYEIVQSVFPEAIVSIDDHPTVFSSPPILTKYSALGLGPGLGQSAETVSAISKILEDISLPLLLDADALNILGKHKDLIEKLPENSILTPHPLEFERLAGKSDNGYDRHILQKEFSAKHKLIVILKGAYTGISFPDGTYVFNTSGNPGMATGGSGDVLSGIIVSLLAQGVSPEKAAIAGVYLHGVAGDFAAKKMGEESMIAGDIISFLGEAFKAVKAEPFLHEGRTGGIIQ
jgi:NAD(P)H-hydrate epimerase